MICVCCNGNLHTVCLGTGQGCTCECRTPAGGRVMWQRVAVARAVLNKAAGREDYQ